MKTYTKEEKKVYFAGLRKRWQAIKDKLSAKEIDNVKAVIAEHGLNVSPFSYYFTALSMKHLGYDGIPYVDCKTFVGWKERGFIVRKGETSKIEGIVWLSTEQKDSNGNVLPAEDQFTFPKVYHLFHKSQVKEI